MTPTDTASREPVDQDTLSRAQKAMLALSDDVAVQLAADHGVCVRPLARRRIDQSSGRVEVVPVPCGSTREDQCGPCADKARRLRMVQCREGWHLDNEPIVKPADPTDTQKELMAARADFHAAYTDCLGAGAEAECAEIREIVEDIDTELRALGVRGRLAPLDPTPQTVRRSTRRRQDAPNLPRRPVEDRTVGRVFGGKYRPSTFLTLTLDTYGRVDGHGAALDPDTYDYRRAARDAIHFPKLLDRFWQNTRRCVGWDVQYFGTVEPQKRGAPHFHAAIRGTIPRAELRAITAATYHQV
ncbi:helitron helicase-like domain-containing protein, partial [Pseudonocardia sp. Ae331_Ps2]